MSIELIAEDGHERRHRPSFENLLQTTKGPVRIASAYVTDQNLLTNIPGPKRKVQLLSSLTLMDIVSGATSLKALRALVTAGVECASLPNGNRLHAKVYVFGEDDAVVTSANLTKSALDSNIEVGVRVTGKNAQALRDWFDGLWSQAVSVGLAEIAKWERETDDLRAAYAALWKKARTKPTLPSESLPSVHPSELETSFDTAPGFFICNTNRRYTPDGRDEDLMRRSHYAIVWTDFRYESHMKAVQKGAIVLMYAKGVGVIGVGRAKGACEILPAGDPKRLATYRKNEEWRVPIEDWLAWSESDADAFSWTDMPNASFLDVSGKQYSTLRNGLRKHFLRRS